MPTASGQLVVTKLDRLGALPGTPHRARPHAPATPDRPGGTRPGRVRCRRNAPVTSRSFSTTARTFAAAWLTGTVAEPATRVHKGQGCIDRPPASTPAVVYTGDETRPAPPRRISLDAHDWSTLMLCCWSPAIPRSAGSWSWWRVGDTPAASDPARCGYCWAWSRFPRIGPVSDRPRGGSPSRFATTGSPPDDPTTGYRECRPGDPLPGSGVSATTRNASMRVPKGQASTFLNRGAAKATAR